MPPPPHRAAPCRCGAGRLGGPLPSLTCPHSSPLSFSSRKSRIETELLTALATTETLPSPPNCRHLEPPRSEPTPPTTPPRLPLPPQRRNRARRPDVNVGVLDSPSPHRPYQSTQGEPLSLLAFSSLSFPLWTASPTVPCLHLRWTWSPARFRRPYGPIPPLPRFLSASSTS